MAFQAFIRAHLELGCLISAALVLTHPEQYALTRGCLERASTLQHLCDRIREWAFGFNVVTLVVNREALTHRDKMSGGQEYLDALLSIGGDVHTTLELPGIGVRFQYTSGTIVFFSGNTHLHGVSISQTERACFALYARPSVHKQLGLPTPRLPTVADSVEHEYWVEYIEELLAWARSQKRLS